jgi:hypothetical protein
MNIRTFLLLLLAAAPAASETCREMRTIRVEVPVAASIPAATLEGARREAAWILRSLCATVEWGPGGLLVRVLPAPLTTDSTADALGMAMPELGRGAVFLSRVSERVAASAGRVSLSSLLGCVLAHEIGHLLLGPAHAAAGVMRADFGKREFDLAGQRQLVFTAAEKNLLSFHLTP